MRAADGDYVPGELVVRYRTGVDASERAATRRARGARLSEKLPIRRLEKIKLKAGQDVEQAVAAFERRPEVLYAEPNYIYTANATPNDTAFWALWAMQNTGQTVNGAAGTPDADIDATEAWDVTTGTANVTLAVVDSGVDYNHNDLNANIWTNPGETGPDGNGGSKETNAVDDDGNGLVDDWRGWDWVDTDNTPLDVLKHGTHVAGTAGASGNDGYGVAGVMWSTKIMPLRVLDSVGGGSNTDIAAAFSYAATKGARVVNASLGGPQYSQAIRDAIAAAPNTLFVVSAGNSSSDNDTTPKYPCNFPEDNLICVAASDQSDNLASFSNYGATSVDLAAPGTNILSTMPSNTFAYGSGTSMAAPHVAGAAGLVFARDSSATPSTVRSALLGSVEATLSLSGKVATGGRLNVFNALGKQPPAEPAPSTPPAPVSPAPPSPEPQPTATVKLRFPRPGSKIALKRLKKIRGKVTNADDVRRVSISLRRKRGKRCWALRRKDLRKRRCSKNVFLRARGVHSWRYRLSKKQRRSLRTGRYQLRVRVTTENGKSVAADGDVKTKFRLKRGRKRR